MNLEQDIQRELDSSLNPSEFLRGQRDCQLGFSAKCDQSDDYNRGYSAEYQKEIKLELLGE